MKKLIIISLILLLCVSVQATPVADAKDTRDTTLRQVESNAGVGTGLTFYVDSNVDNGPGTTKESAVGTTQEAIDLCVNDRGDVVEVMEGHAETMGTGSINVNKSGVMVRGFGRGSLAPTLTYDTSTDSFIISAANVRVEGIRHLSSVTGVVSGIDVQSTGDNAEIVGCDFLVDAISVDEFLTAINVADGANDVLLRGNFIRMQNGGANAAITCGAVSGIVISDNFITGDYAIAVISNPVGVSDDVIIEGNTLINGHLQTDTGINGVAAIVMSEGTTGYAEGNTFVANVQTALLVRIADDMIFVNNFITTTDGDEFSGTIESNATSITATPSN